MDNKQIRLANLAILKGEFGTFTKIAALSKAAESNLSQIHTGVLLPSGKPRGIGDALARKLESGCRKPHGWMDEVHRSQGDKNNENVSPVLGKTDKVPLISFVQAGAWAEAIDNFQPGDAEDWITCPAAHGPHTYALTVDGDSMTASYGRTFPHGCTIYVDPDQVSGVKSSDCVIAKHNGDDTVTFKVFIEDAGRKFLKPLNPQYLVITEEFHVIGKVIGKFEKV